jgi:hypothetical protein
MLSDSSLLTLQRKYSQESHRQVERLRIKYMCKFNGMNDQSGL